MARQIGPRSRSDAPRIAPATKMSPQPAMRDSHLDRAVRLGATTTCQPAARRDLSALSARGDANPLETTPSQTTTAPRWRAPIGSTHNRVLVDAAATSPSCTSPCIPSPQPERNFKKSRRTIRGYVASRLVAARWRRRWLDRAVRAIAAPRLRCNGDARTCPHFAILSFARGKRRHLIACRPQPQRLTPSTGNPMHITTHL